jgi:hypothetical protein
MMALIANAVRRADVQTQTHRWWRLCDAGLDKGPPPRTAYRRPTSALFYACCTQSRTGPEANRPSSKQDARSHSERSNIKRAWFDRPEFAVIGAARETKDLSMYSLCVYLWKSGSKV